MESEAYRARRDCWSPVPLITTSHFVSERDSIGSAGGGDDGRKKKKKKRGDRDEEKIAPFVARA